MQKNNYQNFYFTVAINRDVIKKNFTTSVENIKCEKKTHITCYYNQLKNSYYLSINYFKTVVIFTFVKYLHTSNKIFSAISILTAVCFFFFQYKLLVIIYNFVVLKCQGLHYPHTYLIVWKIMFCSTKQ